MVSCRALVHIYVLVEEAPWRREEVSSAAPAVIGLDFPSLLQDGTNHEATDF